MWIMQTIESTKFIANIDEIGVRLVHLIDRASGYDYVWDNALHKSDKPVTFPGILFPAIGRSNQDSYVYRGKTYSMPQHGFASDFVFTIVAKSHDKVIMTLSADEKTKKMYPFTFELTVLATIDDNGLHWKFEVKNCGKEVMPFSLGNHPGFNVPINHQGEFTDYTLSFDPAPAKLSYYKIIKKPYPFRRGDLATVPNYSQGKLHLNYAMFAEGLVIIENKGIDSVTLASSQTQRKIQLNIKDFRYLCLWTKENTKHSLLCLEPFEGLPDIYGNPVDWSHKEANNFLAPEKTEVFRFDVLASSLNSFSK